tara:strand:+ start:1278 stop:1712 length:435 start_codon:yes stop_codon:yes gene_type:complete
MESIKFKPNEKHQVRLKYDKPKESEGQFGLNRYYGVTTVQGDSGFNASPGLHNLIQAMGKKQGDQFVIEKKLTDEDIQYFTIDGMSMGDLKNKNADASPAINPSDNFEIDKKSDMDFYSERLDKLEKRVAALESGKKEDNEIPW